jgi:Ser/Thr protein kinase RdoA (MazF antagonist)
MANPAWCRWLEQRTRARRTVALRTGATVDRNAAGGAAPQREIVVVKGVRQLVHFERECAGCEYAARILGGRAPRLLARDESRLLIALGHVRGELAQHGRDRDPETHVQAAQLLRRLHDGSPAVDDSALGERIRASFERFAARCGGLVATDELSAVRGMIECIEGVPVPVVACHGDFSPRNWLVDEDGVVRLIDFGRFQRDHWTMDLLLMSRRYWLTEPRLRDAFFAGYGRMIEEVDRNYLRAAIGRWAVGTILWAREHDDAPFEELGREALADLLTR